MFQQTERPLLLPILALALAGLRALPGDHALRAQPPAAQQVAADVSSPTSLAELKDLNNRVKALVEKVRPAIVQVSGGSGVVISADGLVMSVAHVGDHAGRPLVFVLPDGRRVRGVTLGNDRGGDAGLMRITDRGNWPHVEVAKPEDIRLGEWCVAVSYPISFDRQQRHLSVRLGRVYHHDVLEISSDCAIMGGDSGGPLFDMQGRVIGISSTCGNLLDENRHVSIDRFRRYWDRLLKGEDMDDLEPGYGAVLGVASDPDVDAARLGEVKPDGPAARAGAKAGDVVTKFAGKEIRTFQDLTAEVRQHKPGEKLEVELHRGEVVLKISVTLGKAETK
ncbi:MAG: S1C family serine protease [Thermoguttaceae bacterium]